MPGKDIRGQTGMIYVGYQRTILHTINAPTTATGRQYKLHAADEEILAKMFHK